MSLTIPLVFLRMTKVNTPARLILLSFLFLLRYSDIQAQTYSPVSSGSTIKFTIKNLGFNTGGSFSGLEGKITFDPQDLPHASFDVSIEAKTINTDNDMRDEHLRSDTYFDVKNYPIIHFVSVKVSAAKNNSFLLSGKLTLKKETKDIEIPFTAESSTDGYIFDGSFRINRKDFGVGGSSTLSENVQVNLHIISKK